MRLFEMILILTIFFSLFNNKFTRNNIKWIEYSSIFLVIVLLLHYFTEGFRWQMYPIYVISIVQIITGVYKILTRNTAATATKRLPLRKFKSAFIVVLIFITITASIILPVGKIPKPQGRFKIGTTSYLVEDASRKEIYTEDPNDTRRFMIQVWYPTDSVKGLKRAPWLEDGKIVSKGIARLMKLPEFLLSHLSLVKSNSYENADISKVEEKYPVIVISHGWTGFKDIHINFAEMFASSGYVVIAIDHAYGSLATVFDNGETAFLNKNALPSGLPKDEYTRYSNNLVSTYAGDIITTLNKLEELNTLDLNGKFKNKLDLNRVGVMGHSTGGGGSVRASILDNRIKAVFGLDPWVEPVDKDLIEKGLNVPALFLRSEQWKDKPNNTNLFSLMENSQDDIQLYSINGTFHNDFTIVNIVSPILKYLRLKGPLDSKKSMEIQQDYALSFFDKYIKGKDQELLNREDSPYREVSNIYKK